MPWQRGPPSDDLAMIGVDNLPGSLPIDEYALPRPLPAAVRPGGSRAVRRSARCRTRCLAPQAVWLDAGRSTPASPRAWRCTSGYAATPLVLSRDRAALHPDDARPRRPGEKPGAHGLDRGLRTVPARRRQLRRAGTHPRRRQQPGRRRRGLSRHGGPGRSATATAGVATSSRSRPAHRGTSSSRRWSPPASPGSRRCPASPAAPARRPYRTSAPTARRSPTPCTRCW